MKKSVLIGGLVAGAYALIFFIIVFISLLLQYDLVEIFSTSGLIYQKIDYLANILIFKPIYFSSLFVMVILLILRVGGEGNSLDKSFFIEGMIYPLLIIAFWCLVGFLIGKIYSKMGKNEK